MKPGSVSDSLWGFLYGVPEASQAFPHWTQKGCGGAKCGLPTEATMTLRLSLGPNWQDKGQEPRFAICSDRPTALIAPRLLSPAAQISNHETKHHRGPVRAFPKNLLNLNKSKCFYSHNQCTTAEAQLAERLKPREMYNIKSVFRRGEMHNGHKYELDYCYISSDLHSKTRNNP